MLTPQYLQRVPNALVDLYGEAEAAILEDMARRINGYDMFIPSAQHQLQMLEEMGAAREEIVGQLARLTGKSNRELEQIMREAGMEAIRADDMVYRAAGLNPAPLSASQGMQRTLQAGLTKTKGLFDNLTRTTANTASRQFERALDAAYMQVTSGAFSSQEAVKRAVKDLCTQGVTAVEYPSGHRDSMDVAVRRATITGVNQTCAEMQLARAAELGVNLVEVTAHAGARPEHQIWQGQIFSRSGKSRKYPDFVSSTGYGTGAGLGGWNCSHSFRPYVEGMPRTYSKELLREYEARDYEYNGQKMTEYEAIQRQREIERNIRRWKREKQALGAIGGETSEAAARLQRWNAAQADFLEQTGLKRQSSREQIAGWGRKEAACVQALARQRKEGYNQAKEAARALIRSGETPKTINAGAQNKHIKTSKGYIQGRSCIYGDLDTAQALVDRYSGTGEPKLTRAGLWTHKEFATADHEIGASINPETGEETVTRHFTIHYGKRGTHIVPRREE